MRRAPPRRAPSSMRRAARPRGYRCRAGRSGFAGWWSGCFGWRLLAWRFTLVLESIEPWRVVREWLALSDDDLRAGFAERRCQRALRLPVGDEAINLGPL